MDRISNVDHLVLLLRQRLLDRARRSAGGAAGKPTSNRKAVERGGLQVLAAVDGIGDGPLRRALVQNILAEQFGAALLNEPQFQQVVDRVTGAMESEPNTARLLDRMVAELRAAAR